MGAARTPEKATPVHLIATFQSISLLMDNRAVCGVGFHANMRATLEDHKITCPACKKALNKFYAEAA